MKILAISGLMLVAAASVVSAAPAKDETAERVSYNRDEGGNARADDSDWVELASPTPAKHGRQFITVDGRYSQLRVDAHKGRPLVKSVRIVYADGKERVMKVNRTLAGKRPTALVDLDSRVAIDHVVIETSRSSATYTVQASRGSSGVATR